MGNKRPARKKFLVKGEVASKMGPGALDNAIDNNYRIEESFSDVSRSNAYSKTNPNSKFAFNHGCDLLEYSIVVKPYIYKKYHIKHSIELDILCYLYPKQYFTRSDYNLLPVRMYNYQFKTMIDLGYFEKCVDNRISAKAVWRLTEFALIIVKDYYLHLSGERTIFVNADSNPFRSKEKIKADEMRERLMLKLKKQSEKNPERFKKFY